MKFKKAITSALAFSLLSVGSLSFAAGAFKDIDNHWAKSTIEWGAAQNVVHGYPDGTFKPNNDVTDAEFLALLIRSYNPSNFTVKQGGLWSDSFYDFANTMNYPVSSNRDAQIKRSDVAEIVASTQGQNLPDPNEAIKWLLVNGIAKGKTSQSVEGFQGNDLLTRAEAVQFIKNIKDVGIAEAKTRPLSPTDTKTLDQQYQEMVSKNPALGTTVKVVTDSSDTHLLPADPITQASVQAFLESLKVDSNTIKGVVPTIPDGDTITLRYKDMSNGPGKWGILDNDRDFSNLKSGDTFQANLVGQGGYLMFDIYKDGHGKNGVRVNFPQMTAEWEAKIQ
jgi:hypothetical protein